MNPSGWFGRGVTGSPWPGTLKPHESPDHPDFTEMPARAGRILQKEIVMDSNAKNLEEAKAWFGANLEGSLLCVKDDGTERLCASFAEATEFYAPAQEATEATEG